MASETTTATIRNVFEPDGPGKPWNVSLDGGGIPFNRVSTFKAPLANRAKELTGQFVTLTYRIEEKPRRDGDGVFTNYYFEGAEPAQTLDSEITANGAEGTPHAIQAQATGQSYGGKSETDRAEIRRAVALKAAAELAPWLKVFANEETRTTVNVLRVAQQLEEYVEKGEDIFGAPAS